MATRLFLKHRGVGAETLQQYILGGMQTGLAKQGARIPVTCMPAPRRTPDAQIWSESKISINAMRGMVSAATSMASSHDVKMRGMMRCSKRNNTPAMIAVFFAWGSKFMRPNENGSDTSKACKYRTPALRGKEGVGRYGWAHCIDKLRNIQLVKEPP